MQEDVPKLTHPPLFFLVGKKPAYSLRLSYAYSLSLSYAYSRRFVLWRKPVAVIKAESCALKPDTQLVLCIHLLLQLLDLRVVDVVVIIHELVDGAVGRKLYYAVRDGLYELVVMA